MIFTFVLGEQLRELRYLYDGNQTTLKTGFINLPHLMVFFFFFSIFIIFKELF